MAYANTNWVYILTNEARTPLYHGSTSVPSLRLEEHLSSRGAKIVAQYKLYKLVWFQACPDKESALILEHRLKRKSRTRKLPMIETFNPDWADMSGIWLREAAEP